MKHRIIKTALIATALLLSASLSFAVENKAGAAGAAKATGNPGSPEKSATAKKAAPETKLVDINSAGKAALKKLQGIGDAEADRIIGGRPYLSKAQLVTRNVIPHALYEQIKRQIVAMQKPEPAAKSTGKQR